MFTGIVETIGEIISVKTEAANVRLSISCSFVQELKTDQSISHNGVCLTVTNVAGQSYEVVCVAETLRRSNLGKLIEGDKVNLERCLRANDRLDGHIVQGHVDETGIIEAVEPMNGSWKFRISYPGSPANITVEKGSICINGVSLTVTESRAGEFSVVIIPHTFVHTTFQFLKPGDSVNLEFDIVGKYIQAMARTKEN